MLHPRIQLTLLALLSLALGYTILAMGMADYNFKIQLEKYGVLTPATLIGYRYVTHRHRSPDGDRPVFSYIAKDGIQRTYVAYEYGLADSKKKLVLSTQKVQITYLSHDPNVARIEIWNKNSSGMIYIVLGSSICLISLALFYSAIKCRLTQRSRGTPQKRGAP